MLFEARNHKVFRGISIEKYHYNIEIGESCYVVRFVLKNGEEYILAHAKTEKEIKIKCSKFNTTFKTKTHFIKVTRISETEYEYTVDDDYRENRCPGTKHGRFKQEPFLECVCDYSVGGGYVYKYTAPKDYEKPDEFTIGASYLAEECRSDNPIFNDEFTIGASFASSDFYEAQNKEQLS